MMMTRNQKLCTTVKLKNLKKAGGTYVEGYWSEEETYQDDAVDYDISKYALAADLVCEDLTVS